MTMLMVFNKILHLIVYWTPFMKELMACLTQLLAGDINSQPVELEPGLLI